MKPSSIAGLQRTYSEQQEKQCGGSLLSIKTDTGTDVNF